MESKNAPKGKKEEGRGVQAGSGNQTVDMGKPEGALKDKQGRS